MANAVLSRWAGLKNGRIYFIRVGAFRVKLVFIMRLTASWCESAPSELWFCFRKESVPFHWWVPIWPPELLLLFLHVQFFDLCFLSRVRICLCSLCCPGGAAHQLPSARGRQRCPSPQGRAKPTRCLSAPSRRLLQVLSDWRRLSGRERGR